MKRKICVALSILILSSTVPVFACLQSDGKSEKDKQVAERICEVFKGIPDILMMSVQETILYVDISREFYDEMMKDKLSATKMVKISDFSRLISAPLYRGNLGTRFRTHTGFLPQFARLDFPTMKLDSVLHLFVV
jgi:hypothetical protein